MKSNTQVTFPPNIKSDHSVDGHVIECEVDDGETSNGVKSERVKAQEW